MPQNDRENIINPRNAARKSTLKIENCVLLAYNTFKRTYLVPKITSHATLTCESEKLRSDSFHKSVIANLQTNDLCR
jgi:hypothetical protein